MSRGVWLVMLSVFVGACVRARPAHQLAPAEATFTGLVGQAFSVELVDETMMFANQQIVRGAAADIEHQLVAHGVAVNGSAPKLMHFTIERVQAPPAEPQECVRVTGQIEVRAQTFMPAQASSASRCVLVGHIAAFIDPLSLSFALVSRAVALAHDGAEKARAEAFASALNDVLVDLDAHSAASH
jgi:hypothetical protein